MSSPPFYNTPRNPYLVKNDGRTAVFRPPLGKTLALLVLGLLFCTIGMTFFVGLTKLGGFDFAQGGMVIGWLYIAGFCILGFGLCLVMTTGTNGIAFDLQARTYRRALAAPAPFPGLRYPDAVGWGNPFLRRTVTGTMSDLVGAQIVEQQDGAQRMYSVYIVFRDQRMFPCVVFYSNSLLDAQEQLQQITSLLSLPALKTLLTADPEPLPAPYQRRLVRNPYLARCDRRTVVFRTPRWRMMLGLFLAGLLAGPLIAASIHEFIRWGAIGTAFLLCVGLPMIIVGGIIVVSSGSNEITFHLDTRTYRRRLLGPGIFVDKNKENITGVGNLLQCRWVDGEMSAIQGIQIIERRGRRGRLYAIRLIWPDKASPQFIACFDTSLEDARVEQAKMASLLGLPVLKADLLRGHFWLHS